MIIHWRVGEGYCVHRRVYTHLHCAHACLHLQLGDLSIGVSWRHVLVGIVPVNPDEWGAADITTEEARKMLNLRNNRL